MNPIIRFWAGNSMHTSGVTVGEYPSRYFSSDEIARLSTGDLLLSPWPINPCALERDTFIQSGMVPVDEMSNDVIFDGHSDYISCTDAQLYVKEGKYPKRNCLHIKTANADFDCYPYGFAGAHSSRGDFRSSPCLIRIDHYNRSGVRVLDEPQYAYLFVLNTKNDEVPASVALAFLPVSVVNPEADDPTVRWNGDIGWIPFEDDSLSRYSSCYNSSMVGSSYWKPLVDKPWLLSEFAGKITACAVQSTWVIRSTGAGPFEQYWFWAYGQASGIPQALKIGVARRIREALLASADEIHAELFSRCSDWFDSALANYVGPNMSWLEFLLPIRDLPSGLLALGHVPKTVKEAAGWFLNYLYGMKTLPSDLEDIAYALAKLVFRVVRENSIQTLRARGIIRDVDGVTGSWRTSMLGAVASEAAMVAAELGIADPLSEIWNCIPFSFAIDWFTGIGDTLARVENRLLYKALELLEVSWSYNASIDPARLARAFPESVVATGGVEIYRRSYETSVPTPDYYQPPDVGSNIRRHWAELLCLTVQCTQ